MSTQTIIQARMGSSRLPGKILMDVAGRPMLARVVERAQQAKKSEGVVVATSTESADDAVEELCAAEGWPCFRGSENDVLDRYYQAARVSGASVVVRVTADCPLLDPVLVDGILRLIDDGADLATSNYPRRAYPRGLDCEAFPFSVLETAWREADQENQREHVTPFIYMNSTRYSIRGLCSPTGYESHRWTVDEPEDLELIRKLYTHLGDRAFGWRDVLAAFDAHPEWRSINAHVEQKKV